MPLPKIALVALAILLASAAPSQSRLMVVLSYQQLIEKSDLVVIAAPVTKTADTKEQAFLPDIVRQDVAGKQSPIGSVGVETTFKVNAVFKGDAGTKQFVLHHYREVDAPGLQIDGPSLVTFDPSDPGTRSSYLLFLVREADGRFAPTGGQTDPGFKVIDPLPFE
jgi:hypothetical protein